jgi:biopolymer transport protein ExbB/TolQ
MNQFVEDSQSPSRQALSLVDDTLRAARRGRHVPLFAALFGVVSLIVLNVLMFHNIYLSLFLGVVFMGFFVGQVMAFRQLRTLRRDLESGRKTLEIVEAAGAGFDPAQLLERLRREAPACDIRDLVLKWLELGMQGRSEGYDTMLEEFLERRAIQENRALSMHDTINSTTLKLGFLGTLIGIILTFPPMKRAILGLSTSDGELRFIRDIALAIDGDQYAILSTLIATGLSILIEFFTIQYLELLFHGVGGVVSRMNEWNTMTLQPVVSARRDLEARADAAERNRARLEEAVVGAQATLERHLAELAAAARSAEARLQELARAQDAIEARATRLAEAEENHARLEKTVAGAQIALEKQLASLATATRVAQGQLDEVARVQVLMEERMARLAEYERQYRDFLTTKSRAVAPEGPRNGA